MSHPFVSGYEMMYMTLDIKMFIIYALTKESFEGLFKLTFSMSQNADLIYIEKYPRSRNLNHFLDLKYGFLITKLVVSLRLKLQTPQQTLRILSSLKMMLPFQPLFPKITSH